MTLTRGRTWYPLADAGPRVGRSARTIRRWVAMGRLPVHLGHVDELDLLRADLEARLAAATPRGVVAGQHADGLPCLQDHRSVPTQRQPSP